MNELMDGPDTVTLALANLAGRYHAISGHEASLRFEDCSHHVCRRNARVLLAAVGPVDDQPMSAGEAALRFAFEDRRALLAGVAPEPPVDPASDEAERPKAAGDAVRTPASAGSTPAVAHHRPAGPDAVTDHGTTKVKGADRHVWPGGRDPRCLRCGTSRKEIAALYHRHLETRCRELLRAALRAPAETDRP